MKNQNTKRNYLRFLPLIAGTILAALIVFTCKEATIPISIMWLCSAYFA